MISSQLMIAFAGHEMPAEVKEAISARPFAGVTLFRQHNVTSSSQVRTLTASLQAAAPSGARPLLIAADQECGQLIGMGDETTQFAGAMAVGAAGDEDLAERVGRATARELSAIGVNVNYAPVCDLATNPDNPALGIRSFGDDPATVGRLVAATVRGLQSEGVVATLKHFPGAGEIATDPHRELESLDRSRDELEARELVPFRTGIEAGARMVMAGHFALPALTGDESLPASLARSVITDLLRSKLGFEGVSITDALDMGALAQGAAQVINAIKAVTAGEDLLLGTPDVDLIRRLEEGLEQADRRGLTNPRDRQASAARLANVREWLQRFDQHPIDVVDCAEHAALAEELARRSITLVRDDDNLLPLRLAADARIAVIQPEPTDLTPADTSSYTPPLLAHAVLKRHAATEEFVVNPSPSDAEIASMTRGLLDYDLIVLGTVSANLMPAQAALAHQILRLDRPTVTVALRTPWDLCAYPMARAHVCSFGILPPTIEALAGALFGEQPFAGRLPVEIGGLHPRGHGLAA